MLAIATKIGESLLLILAVLVFNFVLVYIAPGSVIDALSAGSLGDASEAQIEAVRERLGLDKSFFGQLFMYLGNVLQGDFGYSPIGNRPVVEMIAPRIFPTLLLAFSALTFAVTIGIAIGTAAARRPDSFLSSGLTVFALIGFAMPVFWTGILLILVFGVWLDWLPVAGMNDLRMSSRAGFFERAVDTAEHLILPTVSLGVIFLATYARLARASMMEVLQSDYIRTARAKGLHESKVLFKHGLRNGIIPIITVLGLEFGILLSGAILVETVFAWPGLGRLAFEAVLNRDTNVLLAILTMVSVTVILANLLTDIVYRLVDPRIRTGGRA
ncbi:ABC transporter permease [Jannaschia marina]|uniref:ABC transporter permease n=1 Tax=Jannaschia marina TaxID=2741674 RepID=UPI0015CE9AEE|nr:ABC transporter permease [Jannaschia marina]